MAYAAGAIESESALSGPYYRGVLTQKYQQTLNLRGSMLAAGLGPEEALPYLDKLESGRFVVACVNSPVSVTLSGDSSALAEIEERMTAVKIFVRKLKVSPACHSHHMLPRVNEYFKLLHANFVCDTRNFWTSQNSSPVTGKTIWTAEELGPHNWVENMTKPVLFAQSLANTCYGRARPQDQEAQQLVDSIIEIGPYSALAGPIRQTLGQLHLKELGISYVSCLE